LGTVYIPQVPAKHDRATGLWTPTLDVSPAKSFGDVRVMFAQRISSGVPSWQVAEKMQEALADYRHDDFLVALGDPSLIAMCSMFIGLKHDGYLRLLTWDRFNNAYICREINLGNNT